eukprot:3834299-Amphidinium_carterae.1
MFLSDLGAALDQRPEHPDHVPLLKLPDRDGQFKYPSSYGEGAFLESLGKRSLQPQTQTSCKNKSNTTT